MIPWFPIFLVAMVGALSLICGVAEYVSNGFMCGERQIIGGLVVVAAALICVAWNTAYMLGYLSGWWS